MEVKHGHPTLDRKQNWIQSICVASDKFWVSLGRTEFQTPMCWRRPNAQAFMLYSAKDALDGWDTYAGWEKEGLRTSSMASLKNWLPTSSLQICLQEGYEVCSHWHRKLEAYGRRSLHMAASHKRGNQACREYTKHATSGEEKYQKSHGHSGTTQYNFQMWKMW